MDTIQPDVHPSDTGPLAQNSWNAPPRSKNQTDGGGGGGEVMMMSEIKNGSKEASDLSRSQRGAQEAVGHLIRNQPQGQQYQDRFPRQDRVYPIERNSGPIFQAEYNYPMSNSLSYIRDADTPPPNICPPPVQRTSTVVRDSLLTLISQPKPKFRFTASSILILVQCILIFLFGAFVTYDEEVTAKPKVSRNQSSHQDVQHDLSFHYSDHVRLHKFYPYALNELKMKWDVEGWFRVHKD